MAKDLPYILVPGKIPDLLKKISDAKVPDSFTHAFLRDTLGFKSTNDRPLLTLLKTLGLIDSSGNPTARYREIKNNTSKGSAIAAGIREAYASVFAANEKANELSAEELKGLVAQIGGTDKDITARITSTLSALIKEADFSELATAVVEEAHVDKNESDDKVLSTKSKPKTTFANSTNGLNTEFHFNIQIHLPNNGTEETYLNIFNALRETFQ